MLAPRLCGGHDMAFCASRRFIACWGSCWPRGCSNARAPSAPRWDRLQLAGRRGPAVMRNLLVVAPEGADIFLEGLADVAAREGWNLHRHAGPPGEVIGSEPLRQADVLLTSGALRCDRSLFEAAPRLRAVISLFIGTEAIDEAAATACGVVVCNGQIPENYEGVAEGTI